jgi:hypothetical protein
MFAGALVGAVLAQRTGLAWALLVAVLVLAAVEVGALVASRRPAAWQASG